MRWLGNKQIGFTLVELIITAGIIALLASIAVPGFLYAQKTAKITAVANELRVLSQAFELYLVENGKLPQTSAGAGVVPHGMGSYMPKKTTWTSYSELKQYWYWVKAPLGDYNGWIILFSGDTSAEDLHRLDVKMDDGNSRTGAMRIVSGSTVTFGVK